MTRNDSLKRIESPLFNRFNRSLFIIVVLIFACEDYMEAHDKEKFTMNGKHFRWNGSRLT